MSPLTIPEILEHIFSYCGETTLRSASCVCHQWFVICRGHFIRELTYEDFRRPGNKRLSNVLSKLQGAGRFRWFANEFYRGKEKDAQKWSMLIAAFQENHERYLQSQGVVVNAEQRWWRKAIRNARDVWRGRRRRGPLLFDAHLQELEISGGIFLETRLTPLLPYLQSLRVLRLRSSNRSLVFMDQLLQSCPELTHLHVEGLLVCNISLPAPWGPFDTTPSRNQRRVATKIGQDQGQHNRLKLRSLVLHSLHLEQSSLECLLTVAPHLEELKVVNLNNVNAGSLQLSTFYSSERLLRLLVQLNLPIRSFHFSPPMLVRKSTEDKVISTISMFPLQTEFSFWVPHAHSLRMIHLLNSIPNNVTTLELEMREWLPIYTSHAMQDSLDTFISKSPQLMHLRAPYFNYLYRYLDIHHRIHPEDTSCAASQRQVWACKNLRTLHISISMPDLPCDDQINTFGRVVFGYITRVCPRLQDLEIRTNFLNLGLNGGLCLLAGLQDLETLRIEVAMPCRVVEPWELGWMADPKSSAFQKSKRQRAIYDWDEALKLEAQVVKEQEQRCQLQQQQLQQQQQHHQGDVVVWDFGCDKKLISDLRHLGLLCDVKSMLHYMDTTAEFRCWPELRKLGFNRHGNNFQMETLFARVLPTKRASFCRF
ncbi:hypothetical protein BGZ50_006103 [Haplosporangium sp. Z 11]|nr:hypothetical protein BGZ50_006103 [Haplosporangium sp. Z 11]